jgi:HD-GYP domain-containing protein (c-di-GMP phosphodiesterase class II)
MKDKVKNVFILLLNAVHAGKLYTEEHPLFQDFVAKLFTQLQDLFGQRREIVLGIVDGELAWEKEIFFDLSQKPGSLRGFLEERRIERIVFHQGLNPEELGRFIAHVSRMKKAESADSREDFVIEGVQNIRLSRLRAAEDIPTDAAPPDIGRQYREIADNVSQSLNAVLREEEIDALDLRFSILNVMENFLGRHQELLGLISIQEKDPLTYIHLLNVSLLSMFFASRLNFGKNEVLDIGTAALFHDMGKLAVASGILQKKGKLDGLEFEQIQDHPLLGAKILFDYRETLGALSMVVAFEHHLRYDGGGYPQLRFPRKPHIASQIVSLCDVYDALSLRRSYKEDFPPDKIHEVLAADRGKAFDPNLVDRFFQAVGVWPVGTLLLLDDYRVAIVREAEENDIRRPRIEVVSPEKSREKFALVDRPEIRILEALHPQKSGKPYLHLI